MAQVRSRPRFPQQVMNVLAKDLQKVGIKAKIETEPVRLTKLHRFVVLSEQFKNMRPSERQRVVWGIIEREFDPDEQLRISMILTVTPVEMGEMPDAPGKRKRA